MRDPHHVAARVSLVAACLQIGMYVDILLTKLESPDQKYYSNSSHLLPYCYESDDVSLARVRVTLCLCIDPARATKYWKE
mmetsp:Transcript_26993/g.39728  ORF Transcript_26993/g.39728 Transcript_26993/m.39728 type:complete len:80 (-) Transcript_26993:485-724(-)